jgi:predicted ATPase
MFITHLQLSNFKRFTDLTIDLTSLAQPPKLVLLIGSNGSGKSSVFDAFESLGGAYKQKPLRQSSAYQKDRDFYQKTSGLDFIIEIRFSNGEAYMSRSGGRGANPGNDKFYGRSCLRQVPKLTRTTLGQAGRTNTETDSDRPIRFIERDERFENDIERITQQILREVFLSNNQTSEIKERYIRPVNEAFKRIFGKNGATALQLIAFNPPLEGRVAEILFQKGNTEIHYDFLSSGEKEVFNILVNLLSRLRLYQDTIYFFDEIDLHLNTRLQYNLLKEITEHWIPDGCQFWTASHSLGFIDYANDADHAAIIDFDDLDFDAPQVLLPQPKNRLEVYEIAVPQETLLKLFRDKRIFICENRNDQYYNLLGFEDTLFVGVHNSNAVFIKIKREPGYYGVRDRDFLTDGEIATIESRFPNYRVLRYYAFENYLYHPDNLAELNLPGYDKDAYTAEIRLQKNEQLIDYIIPNIQKSRDNYEELKEAGVKEKDILTITRSLQSDDFETFYRFYDMKSRFNKKMIESLNIAQDRLVRTDWFRGRIKDAIFDSLG